MVKFYIRYRHEKIIIILLLFIFSVFIRLYYKKWRWNKIFSKIIIKIASEQNFVKSCCWNTLFPLRNLKCSWIYECANNTSGEKVLGNKLAPHFRNAAYLFIYRFRIFINNVSAEISILSFHFKLEDVMLVGDSKEVLCWFFKFKNVR